MLASCQAEVKRRKDCLLNYWKHGGHFKNKRVPLDKCHLDLLPLRGCLSVSLSHNAPGCTHTDTQGLLNTSVFIPTTGQTYLCFHVQQIYSPLSLLHVQITVCLSVSQMWKSCEKAFWIGCKDQVNVKNPVLLNSCGYFCLITTTKSQQVTLTVKKN